MIEEDKGDAHLINITENPGDRDAVHLLLQQIVQMLDRLLAENEPGHIDLSERKLSANARAMLLQLLGENGTRADVQDYGNTQITSTGIPGVWWVQHLDGMDQVIGEFIEVNYCPEVLIAVTEDMREGREALKSLLFEAQMARKRRNPGP
jgi:hydrogenase-1 operon protein HyaF